MKKILMVITTLCVFSVITYGRTFYEPISGKTMMQNGDILSWVSDIKSNKGHVTYTLNVQIPLEHKNDILLAWTRRDYICIQAKEAILWGKAEYLNSGEFIDYTPYIDKTKLKKYAPVDEYSTEVIDQIEPYCDYNL